ncbi:uncharacterized protein [Glycine max]|uniref:uncharacterized protein n=1 Tax=Glycine max TaxID=3847 RepID=UPI0003DE75E9|nr:uncharacterized protein LOC102664015 [Glycine max]|eukprot:XP_006574258.1 uncharacterized protein LOC102664015 [Glycine max]
MVRTGGLGPVLSRVSGRGLGRGDRDDSDDAPLQRRPTTSERRQRVPVIVVNTEPVVPATEADVAVAEADIAAAEVDVAVDEPMIEADVQDIGVDTVADTSAQAATDEPEGFPGGATDPSERPELKLSSHGRKVHNLGRPVPAIKVLVVGTGLSPLIACSVDTDDRGLLSSFVERWHRETSSFHLPVGEVTITLDDVASLLHLPVVGDLHTFQPLHVNEAVLMLVDLLMVSPEAARVETAHYHGPYVHLSWIYEHFPSVVECNAGPDYDEASPCACRWITTKKTVKSIYTGTYGQRLDRVRIPDVY